MRLHSNATVNQLLRDLDGGRLPQVVGVGLEGQAQQSNGAAFENFQFLKELFDDPIALPSVDLPRCFDDGQVQTIFARCRDQSGGVLAEARAPPAESGAQKAWTDPGTQPNTARHFG